ncbi:branched-chain amino acid transport system permease protein [Mesorhizobium sp. J18]|uniref:branched-chain amino acid ABC transporter ATP-binding protein/permease n=1 Tax=Mesorhizobium sp. J18 TaxID=935263 RepID=UPI0011996766|nr:branched-chain amino acid ABC transporter ATP-binding protein/permease [Mesorhizobium sp. J18]TWG94256.1 branched-chain amino acid transport system permease protein [Mesorhizobium sp. J18]
MSDRRKIGRPLAVILAIAAVWFAMSFVIENAYYALLLTIIPIWATFAISWNIFSGYSGLISFGHAAFFGLGAYTIALTSLHFDLTPWFGLPLAAIVGVVAGAVIGYPTFRLSGLYFALAMLAYPLSMVYVFEWLGYQEIILPMRPENPLWYMQFGSYHGYLAIALALLVLSVLLSLMIERSRFGLSLLAIKQNELAAEASGVDTFRWKMRALVLSGALAATAGGLYAVVVFVLTPGSVFGVIISAQAIILSLFGGAGIVWGPLIGAATLLPLSETLHAELGSVLPGIQGLLYGVAIMLVILLAPEGIYWRVRDLLKRRRGEAGAASAEPRGVAGPVGAKPSAPRPQPGETLLSVRSLSKTYGGLKAVSDVSFDVREGEILGIIGPNGAGKTTLFNMLNGIVVPDAGEIRFEGRDIAGLKPNRVCRLGIGRTFQVVRAFQRMGVLENVAVGAYVHADSEEQAWALAKEAVAMVGLADSKDTLASTLTSKELRLMELARALASRPRLVLLDEPLAGLGSTETEELMSMVATLPAHGITVIIIEHTIGAMVDLADRFVVLDHGRFLTQGAPRDVTRDPRVIEAYLGQRWAAKHA